MAPFMMWIMLLNSQGGTIHACEQCRTSVYFLSPFPIHIFLCDLHRDCTYRNIMLDPSNMYPDSFHPVKMGRSKDFRHRAKGHSRTWRPTRYLLIDFGLSRQYDPANGPPLDRPLRGGDKSAPEHQDGETLCDPFHTDVYYLGNLVRKYYSQVCLLLCL